MNEKNDCCFFFVKENFWDNIFFGSKKIKKETGHRIAATQKFWLNRIFFFFKILIKVFEKLTKKHDCCFFFENENFANT
jgi:hypothetical protein